MEAVGTAAAIIQLAGVGLALAKTLYSLYGEGASSNEQVKELSFYVKSTSIALEAVGNVFQEESKAKKPLISENAIITANDVVSRCTDIFKKLGKIAEDGQKSTLSLLVFPLKSSRLQVLQTRLEQSKLDLQLMMQVIIYARLKVQPTIPQYNATTTSSSIVDEPAQRKVVNDLIVQRAAVYQKDCEEGDIEELNTGPEPNNSSSSSSPSNSIHQNPTSALRTLCISDPSPLPSSSPKPPDGSLPPVARSEQHKDQFSSGKANRTDPNEVDVSYWVALYLVCCPCFARKKSRRTQPGGIFDFDSSQMDIPSLPIADAAPTVNLHSRMKRSRVMSSASTMDYIPQKTSAIANIDKRSSRPQVSDRSSYPIHELPADSWSTSSPIFQSPQPAQFPTYGRRAADSTPYSPIYDSAVPPPNDSTAYQSAPMAAPRSRRHRKAPLILSSQEETHSPEVDRLLREWTTIYD
ncbi:hypothetical protein PHISCL_06427 [Aspergillus sclerotialis]|uniref:Fungal N-terminal domain-containing protein n=1 Tax=Aspergillus sclerotialis TaxID=2070753 RepID=A0A3A2ZTE6_9EURO|nr:hypothetical protein PHISCL_06427 [Aspergillus sclerotialis]